MLYLIFVSLIWGFSFVIIKGSLTSLDTNFVSFARVLLSLLVFIPFMRPAAIGLRDKLQLTLIGSVQFGLMYLAYIAAFRDLPAHVIALLTTTTPVFVSIISGLYARRMQAMVFLAAFLAVAGGAVLQLPDQPLSANIGDRSSSDLQCSFCFRPDCIQEVDDFKNRLARQKHIRVSLRRRGSRHRDFFTVHNPI